MKKNHSLCSSCLPHEAKQHGIVKEIHALGNGTESKPRSKHTKICPTNFWNCCKYNPMENRQIAFSTNGAGTLENPLAKKKERNFQLHLTKLNSKGAMDLNLKPKTTKLLEK